MTREGAMFHTESETIFAYNPLDGEPTKVILNSFTNTKDKDDESFSPQESAYQLDQKLKSNSNDNDDESASKKEEVEDDDAGEDEVIWKGKDLLLSSPLTQINIPNTFT